MNGFLNDKIYEMRYLYPAHMINLQHKEGG